MESQSAKRAAVRIESVCHVDLSRVMSGYEGRREDLSLQVSRWIRPSAQVAAAGPVRADDGDRVPSTTAAGQFRLFCSIRGWAELGFCGCTPLPADGSRCALSVQRRPGTVRGSLTPSRPPSHGGRDPGQTRWSRPSPWPRRLAVAERLISRRSAGWLGGNAQLSPVECWPAGRGSPDHIALGDAESDPRICQ